MPYHLSPTHFHWGHCPGHKCFNCEGNMAVDEFWPSSLLLQHHHCDLSSWGRWWVLPAPQWPSSNWSHSHWPPVQHKLHHHCCGHCWRAQERGCGKVSTNIRRYTWYEHVVCNWLYYLLQVYWFCLVTICCILAAHQQLFLKVLWAGSHYHYAIICQVQKKKIGSWTREATFPVKEITFWGKCPVNIGRETSFSILICSKWTCKSVASTHTECEIDNNG